MANRNSKKIYSAIGYSSRATLYTVSNDEDSERFVFENPVYSLTRGESQSSKLPIAMKNRDFLASITFFADFTDAQLNSLEQNGKHISYSTGDVIFQQGDQGDAFYVIQSGGVDILKQSNGQSIKKGDYGKVVNSLTQGQYFGERALMTSEPRAATIRANQDTMCIAFSRKVFEEVIAGSNALIGCDPNDQVDWSEDHETRSLSKHLEQILDIYNKSSSSKIRKALLKLTNAITPELSVDEIISRMVITVKSLLKTDRVGLFILSEDKRSMVLKVSDNSKGVTLPLGGLAGAVLISGRTINIPNAYLDSRFNPLMDNRTGFKTKQVLCVPIHHPVSKDTIGALQVNNLSNGSSEPFTLDQENLLKRAAEVLSEEFIDREDVFLYSGGQSKPKYFGSKETSSIGYTADITSPFVIETSFISIPSSGMNGLMKKGLTVVDITFTLFLALTPLCKSETVEISLDNPSRLNNPSRNSFSGISIELLASTANAEWVTIPIRETIKFNIAVKDLPRATRVMVNVSGRKKNGPKQALVPIGWAATTVFDYQDCVDSSVLLKLFPGSNDFPIKTTLNNTRDALPPANVSIRLMPDLIGNSGSKQKSSKGRNESVSFVKVVHSMPQRIDPITNSNPSRFNEETLEQLNRMRLLSFNPMGEKIMTDDEKKFVWDNRYNILDKAELLLVFVMSVQWNDAEKVKELYELLDLWRPPPAALALQLLDRRFMDPKVRAFAVHCLEELDDEELGLYMLQLCQQLKFESHIDSALSRFLLRKALGNRRLIGHIFFWFLQSEVDNVDVKRRFSSLLEMYLRFCGDHRVQLGHQMFVMKRLEKVAEKVLTGDSEASRLAILRKELEQQTNILPSEFQLPLNPKYIVKGIDISKCKVMNSKKKPLWLNFINASKGEPDIVIMMKVGDDLRQDALILQLLRVMDEIWKKEGLDMQMNIYEVISTGDQRGLIHVVKESTTLERILARAADSSNGTAKPGTLARKLVSAYKAVADYSVMKNWIYEQVCEDVKDENRRKYEMERRTQNFMVTCAAYCVASYVLGLADRHNGNLMITKSANFFHIDFGHILGNVKKKLGVTRERAPFIFTYSMKEVMDEEQYEQFVDLCCDIYNVLRDNASLLVSLCSLAIPCNLPELQKDKDVMWVYDKLKVDYSDEDASRYFKKQLKKSLETRTTLYNDAAHMIAHA